MPTKKQLEAASKLAKNFDWSRVDALTDKKIIAAAKTDPDTSLPSGEELDDFDLVVPVKSRKAPDAAE